MSSSVVIPRIRGGKGEGKEKREKRRWNQSQDRDRVEERKIGFIRKSDGARGVGNDKSGQVKNGDFFLRFCVSSSSSQLILISKAFLIAEE